MITAATNLLYSIVVYFPLHRSDTTLYMLSKKRIYLHFLWAAPTQIPPLMQSHGAVPD